MKIGILTYWWSKDNYGQQLQCYALQKYLQDVGYEAYLIRYDMRNDRNCVKIETPVMHQTHFYKKVFRYFNPIKIYRYLLYKKQATFIFHKNRRNDTRNFEYFREEYIKQSKIYYSYYELKENPPKADIYIVGSDQVWNTDFYLQAEEPIEAYFLNFGDSSIKRISYAASFGKEKLEDEIINKITPLLQKFDYVSVREKSGLNICKQCGVDAEWVCDPTMLLGANVYRTLYKKELWKKQKRPYCFFYFLKNECDFCIEDVYNWAKKKNLKVIYISANSQLDKYRKTFATIPEWIYLLENAEFVITNSYHCCVFSLLFEKKFGVIPLSKSHYGMNSRFDSLFEQFQIENRFLNSNFSILDKEINWQLVSNTFQNLRKDNNLTMHLW